MRDLMFLGAFLVLLPLAFRNAFVAYLIWGWTGLIAIENYLFGFMMPVKLNFIFALITMLMILFKKDTERGVLGANATVVLLSLFFLQGSLSAVFAYDGNQLNWELYDRFWKELVFAMLMPLVVVKRYRIHAFVLVMCLGLGFHGLIDGLKFFSSGGSHLVRGFKKFGDNNHFAVMLVMAVPLLLYMTSYSKSRWLRLAALAVAIITIAAVIGTRSRGGFVAMVAVGLWLVLTSRKKLPALTVFVAGIIFVVAIAPESWTQRMETIQEAEQDSSFMSRVEAWQVSSAIALHNPLTGGGFHAVATQSVWDQFRGQKGLLGFIDSGLNSAIFRAAHSVYFEVMGDMGFSGFIIFMALLLNALKSGVQISRLARQGGPELEWALDLSRSLASTIFAFLVGGLTVSIAYTEFIYMAVMLMEILKREVQRAVSEKKERDEMPTGDPVTLAALAPGGH
ncbi:MAG: putative O-glycosylation ligase, exosortase A system-associated [Rhodocyclales bacterium]|nr:putative O-glycosylation ligase, exosortase A system-associated [Rhodocyclales bacterium]